MVTRRCPQCHRETWGAGGPRVNWLCPHCGADLLWLADPKPLQRPTAPFRRRRTPATGSGQRQPATV